MTLPTEPLALPLALPSRGCHIVDGAALPLAHQPVPADQVAAGAPTTGHAVVATGTPVEVGVWEHTTGSSTDVEAEEVFVVLTGRATVEVEDGPVLELGPGSIGVLAAGARTTWTVHEPLRKVYVTPA